ncbi:zinc finger-containing cysteine-rich protein [Cryptosporidium canis]|uniref:Zinc finger-containing cysteine-rich protein n=1 Tax=Cryptosporidium canis TaxID=195482 RepID=A0ABQ8P2Q9_9CRYT|nr:zinc finger-containing cysteine-rich protein [Cryptosporidium canis]KAJ1606794.1 zinc finger-containing cysteine-rich protein [Cryptosporidium canis]
MDDIYLAEFHGFVDEKTWEVSKLSTHYLQTLRDYALNVLKNGGVLERYSDLRDLIEIVRICILHGILVGVNYFQESKEIHDYGSLYHFVKIFPELNELGKVDDMCFLSFLLLNNVFTGFLESFKSPSSKWNQRIAIYYHHASILRYGEFLKEFIFIVKSFEHRLRIKNFHIPNNWMTHFAKLSLRWNNFGIDQAEISVMREITRKDLKQKSTHLPGKSIRDCSNLSDLGLDSKSSLNILLEQEFDKKLIIDDYNIYDDRAFISKSSILNSNVTFITDYNSNNDLEGENVVYDEGNIQDIEELLENMWNPVFDYSQVSREVGFESQKKKKILQGMTESKVKVDLSNDETRVEDIQSEHQEDYLMLSKDPDFSCFKINYEIKFIRNDINEAIERYLYFYQIPLNHEEEKLVLELQNYKCFTSQCKNILNEEARSNFCCYTGYYYCDNCFGQSTCSILPGLLAKYGNLTPVPVSSQSRKELKNLENIPLIKMSSLTAQIWESNKYIKKLVYLKSYLSSLFTLNDFEKIERDSCDHKCQYRESIKRRLIREYDIMYQYGRYEYFSVSQLMEIACEIFSQEVTMYSSETNLQIIVRELANIALNWRRHLTKCIYCQLQSKDSDNTIKRI